MRSLVLVASGAGGFSAELSEDTPRPPWEEMERLWDAKDWRRLAELETQVWVDGWGQPPTRIEPDLRQQVHDWILATYEARKEEGQPEPLEPPAAGRLHEIHVPTLVMVGTADEPGGIVNSRHVAATVPGARLVEFPDVVDGFERSGMVHAKMGNHALAADFYRKALDFVTHPSRRDDYDDADFYREQLEKEERLAGLR